MSSSILQLFERSRFIVHGILWLLEFTNISLFGCRDCWVFKWPLLRCTCDVAGHLMNSRFSKQRKTLSQAIPLIALRLASLHYFHLLCTSCQLCKMRLRICEQLVCSLSSRQPPYNADYTLDSPPLYYEILNTVRVDATKEFRHEGKVQAESGIFFKLIFSSS